MSIIPLGRGVHLSSDLGQILKIIDESGIRYQLTPSGTCIEGEWDEVMALVRRCHEQARVGSTHVMTTLRIEDELGATDKLHENIASVERSAGRAFHH
ncbi:MAG: MTH1187 family thiamine-binding protein [Blastocatellia bacterium]|nr:MTH1187 family thiamine-binding protein [Blastocatellia bacterium]